jgi:hypothetical protein
VQRKALIQRNLGRNEKRIFLKDKLQAIYIKFPFLSIRYQYDKNDQTHMVEILPLAEFENNKEYQKEEAELTFDFDNLFFPESLMFVSGNSLTKITETEFEINPSSD